MSEPRSRGFWKYGLANVLSTATGTLLLWAISEIAEISASFRKGLIGDSGVISGLIYVFATRIGYIKEKVILFKETKENLAE